MTAPGAPRRADSAAPGAGTAEPGPDSAPPHPAGDGRGGERGVHPAGAAPSAPGTGRTDGAPDPSGYADLGYARVDTDRARRQGVPEVVYGPGKRPEEIAGIAARLLGGGAGPVLATRVGPEAAADVSAAVPGGTYDPSARVLCWRPRPQDRGFTVAVVTAGTADGPVADEAAAVARAIGLTVLEERDVGVAGLHRLLAVLPRIEEADAVICVAGMEGALASVLGGLAAAPVVAVPTSTGYGAALEGVTALLAMASSCASGLTVVNIDGGFSAAMAVHRMAVAAERRDRRGAAAAHTTGDRA
ncbi:hypothetical protein GCM10027440_00060 [Nocardiopsis coralliicola]